MPTPTREQLRDPEFCKHLLAALEQPVKREPLFAEFFKRPKFRKMREVHAQRARKLRRRGEYVHFLRWEHGHCIYGWSGKVPDTFVLHRMPRKQAEPVYTHVDYRVRLSVSTTGDT